MERRVQKLHDRAEKLSEARKIRVSARSENYTEQKRKLQSRIDALDEANDELKPLVSRLHQLKNELVLEEKPAHLLVLAWNFFDEIVKQLDAYKQGGGKFVVPVPAPRVR